MGRGEDRRGTNVVAGERWTDRSEKTGLQEVTGRCLLREGDGVILLPRGSPSRIQEGLTRKRSTSGFRNLVRKKKIRASMTQEE